ncbi:hypothetical protein [Sphingobium sp. AntQ-1]|uniref:hypothetical protein n=1 Tax=Sphingobium sp. AntQ-1 TaxID=2930091 RepID=UPI00234F7C6F|nr:hypothetical protein [Sphingobium sp. AntQ-1]
MSETKNKKSNVAGLAVLGVAIVLLAMCGRDGGSEAPTIDSPVFKDINNGMVFSMVSAPGMDAERYLEAARSQCEGKQICQVIAWNDAENAGTAMPLLDREAQAVVFNYSLNRTTGFEQALWRCTKFKRPNKGQCLAD